MCDELSIVNYMNDFYLNQLNELVDNLTRDLFLHEEDPIVNCYWSTSESIRFLEIEDHPANDPLHEVCNYIWSDPRYGGTNVIEPFFGSLDDWLRDQDADQHGDDDYPAMIECGQMRLSSHVDTDEVFLQLNVQAKRGYSNVCYYVKLDQIANNIRMINAVMKEKKQRIISSIESTTVLIATAYESVADIKNLAIEILGNYVDQNDVELYDFGLGYINKFIASNRFNNLVRETL